MQNVGTLCSHDQTVKRPNFFISVRKVKKQKNGTTKRIMNSIVGKAAQSLIFGLYDDVPSNDRLAMMLKRTAMALSPSNFSDRHEKYKTPQCRQPVFVPRFELGIFRTQSKSDGKIIR
jgi:hypothetical protein